MQRYLPLMQAAGGYTYILNRRPATRLRGGRLMLYTP